MKLNGERLVTLLKAVLHAEAWGAFRPFRMRMIAVGMYLVLAACACGSAASAAPRVRDSIPVFAFAAVAADSTPTVTAPAVPEEHGVPWWTWPLLAVVVLAALFGLVRRRKTEPNVTSRSSLGDPN